LLKQIDEYVSISEDCKLHEDNINQRIEESLTNLLIKKLDLHGFKGSIKKAQELISLDMSLNASGLANWIKQN
jgi:Tat protein secretion system quality control protein TatD with DNase activity